MNDIICTYKLPKLPLSIDVESKVVLKKLAWARAALAELNGITKLIPKPEILINALTLQEAKDSSAIENIITTHDELYQADINIGSMSSQTKEVQDYKKALIEWYQYVKEHKNLIINHIRDIQQAIEHNNAGIRKISGTMLKNDQTWDVVYIPPQDHKEILHYLTDLEQYINTSDDTDPLIKIAIIHHQFESIHPFHDGNGRTGRIINILYLVLEWLLDLPVLYLSGYIIKHKSEYYRLLQQVRDTGERELRILYILDGIEQTSLATTKLIKEVWTIVWETKKIMKEDLTQLYSKDFLELLFNHPYTKIDFVVKELWVVRQTASKYLQELEKVGILQMIPIQKEKYYVNMRLYDLFRKWLQFEN
jgi:Fic family protein